MWVLVVSLRSTGARFVYLLALLVLSLWFFVPQPAQPATSPPLGAVYRVQTHQRAIALTINVVWGTEFVPQMLHDLEESHVHATFMVGGAWAKAHPALVKDMARAGMEIGNHGWNHPHPNQLSYAENLRQIEDTNAAIKGITGTAPKAFAPPYGEFNQTVLRASAALSMPLVMWTIDTIDWNPSSSVPYMVAKVNRLARPGAIVLMHPTNRTVVALPMIIQRLTQSGYRLVTVSQLLTMGTPQSDG